MAIASSAKPGATKKIPFVKLPPRVEVDNYKASYLRM
jgi:hypothetical protein